VYRRCKGIVDHGGEERGITGACINAVHNAVNPVAGSGQVDVARQGALQL
jgi:hypothetical protein